MVLGIDDAAEHLLRRGDHEAAHLGAEILDRAVALGGDLGARPLDEPSASVCALAITSAASAVASPCERGDDLPGLRARFLKRLLDLRLHAGEALLGLWPQREARLDLVFPLASPP